MALPQEVYEYGTSNSPLVDEADPTPAFLVDSLTINVTRTKNEFQNAEGTTTRVKYTDPKATLEFQGKIALESDLCVQHPGTLVTSLANYQSTLHGMDPSEGILVYEDPSRSLSEDQDYVGLSFTVAHYPFISV